MKQSKISKIISVLLTIIFIVGIVCLVFIPFLYNIFSGEGVISFEDHSTIYKIAFYTCYLICLAIIFLLIKLFNIVYSGSPFKKEIENILKTNALLFMVLFVLISLKTIFIPTLLSFSVALTSLLTSLSFYVLSQVIKAAILYKNEIDYTV